MCRVVGVWAGHQYKRRVLQQQRLKAAAGLLTHLASRSQIALHPPPTCAARCGGQVAHQRVPQRRAHRRAALDLAHVGEGAAAMWFLANRGLQCLPQRCMLSRTCGGARCACQQHEIWHRTAQHSTAQHSAAQRSLRNARAGDQLPTLTTPASPPHFQPPRSPPTAPILNPQGPGLKSWHWRKSSQWFGMLRSHAQLVLEDSEVFRK